MALVVYCSKILAFHDSNIEERLHFTYFITSLSLSGRRSEDERCICEPLIHIKAGMHAKSLQSGLTLYDPMDHSLPGSSVHGILQARILEWVAISFSNIKAQRVENHYLSSGRLVSHFMDHLSYSEIVGIVCRHILISSMPFDVYTKHS